MEELDEALREDSSFTQYEDEVMATANPISEYRHRCLKGVLGLVSEAGELSGIYEKIEYQGHVPDVEAIKKEVGDVLWYLTYFILVNGWTLQEIMEHNTAKLRERYPKGHFDADDSMRRVDGG